MRKYLLLVTIVCSVQLFAQNQVVINGTKTKTDYVSIASIVNSDAWTEVVLAFNPTTDINATLHEPNGKSPFVLMDRDGKQHLLVYQKGWKGDKPGGYGSILLAANQKKTVTLFFNKLEKPEDVYSLNESKCEGDGCWFFNDISFFDEKIGTPVSGPLGVMLSANAEQNIIENGEKGVVVYLNLRVMNMKNADCQIALRFQNEEKEFLETSNSKYANSIGEIRVAKDLKPSAIITDYEKLAFFVPYTVFNLSSGTKNVRVDFDLDNLDGTVIKHITISSLVLTNN